MTDASPTGRDAVLNRVRKGDVIAVRVRGSYTSAKMERTETSEFILATVNTASRDGACRTFVKRSGAVETVDRARHDVLTISDDRQPDAKRLLRSLAWDKATWPDADSLKQALREADTRDAA